MALKENNMSDKNATLTLGGEAKDYAVMDGTVGPQVIDVRKLYANTGMFTYDPGFLSTASCQSAITMFDMRIGSDLDKGEDLLRLGWGSGGMMKMMRGLKGMMR